MVRSGRSGRIDVFGNVSEPLNSSQWSVAPRCLSIHHVVWTDAPPCLPIRHVVRTDTTRCFPGDPGALTRSERLLDAPREKSSAQDKKGNLEASRLQYENALKARKNGVDTEALARASRNLAKEEFLDVYAEVASRIEAAFPRDKKTQDLFFLKDKSTDDDNDDDDGNGT